MSDIDSEIVDEFVHRLYRKVNNAREQSVTMASREAIEGIRLEIELFEEQLHKQLFDIKPSYKESQL